MLLELHRLAHWACQHRIPVLPKLIYVFNRIVFSAAIQPEATIG